MTACAGLGHRVSVPDVMYTVPEGEEAAKSSTERKERCILSVIQAGLPSVQRGRGVEEAGQKRGKDKRESKMSEPDGRWSGSQAKC